MGAPARPDQESWWPRWLPVVWSTALAVLLLGPALAPGYVLSYDMVWVPDLALRPDTLGLGTGLPRAVPSDAVVAVLDELVPGALLQKCILVGALVGAGVGAARLVTPLSTVGRLAAVSVYQWNPFVVERLLIGHWPVLAGYAVLPWVILAARRMRETGRPPASLWVLLPLGSLSAGAGLVTAAALTATGLSRRHRRVNALVVGLVVASNAPWIVAGVLHAGSAESAAVGARVFALAAAGELPAPVAAVGLGGIWNAEVVLASRQGLLGAAALALFLTLAALGVRGLMAVRPRRDVAALAGCWALGWGAATATWLLPDAVGWLVAHVPGAGVVRDGSRLLALCAPLLTALVAHGAAAVERSARAQPSRAALALAVVLAPVAVMPDAAFGGSGRLRAVDYPAAYADARGRVSAWRSGGGAGDVLVLPFTSYRAPEWNGGRKVLDPVPRALTLVTVSNDDLVVSGTTVPGEDPRARAAEDALQLVNRSDRERRLAQLGIGLLLEEQRNSADDTRFVLRPLSDVDRRRVPAHWWWAAAAAWAVFAGLFLAGCARVLLPRCRCRATRG